MKVTPIAGPNMGSAQAGNQTTSPDRKEAAKQAFLGNTGTEIKKPDDPAPLIDALNIKKIKMNTNASPERFLAEAEALSSPEVVESATPDTPETVEQEVTRPISPQFAALAKQRRALELQAKDIAQQKAALEQQVAGKTGIDVERLKSNPLEVLKESGVTYEALTEAILAEQSGIDPKVRALEAKIEALEKGLDEKLSKRDEQAEQQVLAEMQREADRLIDSDPEFDTIKGTQNQKAVTKLIHQTWKATGEILDVQEAAKLVEDQLVQDGVKWGNFAKVRKQLAPEVVQTPAQKPYGLKTLTNRDTAQRPSSSKARAIAAFNGTLKR